MAISDQEQTAVNNWLAGKATNEREARRALARILRQEPLSMNLRRRLASLFDPDISFGLHFVLERSRGRPKRVNDLGVAAIVWDCVRTGNQKKAAYHDAAKKAGISHRAAEKAFAKHKKNLRGLNDWGLGEEISKIANELD